MSPLIETALKREIDAQSRARGRAYADQGHVKFWEISPGGRELEADVDGTYEYSVHITLAWSANGLLKSFSGSCSCPVSFDCKHVAAAMFAADDVGAFVGVTESDTMRNSKSGGWADRRPDHRAGHSYGKPVSDWNSPEALKKQLAQYDELIPNLAAAGKASAQVSGTKPPGPELDHHLRNWLSAYRPEFAFSRFTSPKPNDYPPGVKDRVRYIVNQDRDRLVVHPVKVSVRKDGSRTPGRADYYNHGNMKLDQPPLFVRPIDVRIFRLFRGAPRAPLGLNLEITDDSDGQTLFQLLLESGRAYWEHEDGLLLSLGNPRAGEVTWRDMGEEQHLMVRTSENAWIKPLPLTPPWYLDADTGQCGLLENELSPAEVKWLASAPPVPAKVADQVLTAMEKAGIELPKPRAVTQERVTDIAPVPVLTLGALKARRAQYTLFRSYQMPFMANEIAPLLRVSFEYDGQHIAADAPDTITRHTGEAHLQVIERNAGLEAQHLQRLLDLADDHFFFPISFLDGEIELADQEPLDLILWPFNGANPDAPEGGALETLDFLEHAVPQLESEGWKVIVEPSWPCQLFDGTVEIHAGVGQQDNDWFSLALNFEVDGQLFDLLPALAEVVESLDEQALEDEERLQAELAGRRLNARLSDGRYARLPVEPLIPALRLIRDLNHKMHAAQAGTLRELADALAGCGVAFDGGDRLIELGARLSALAKHSQSCTGAAHTNLPAPPETFKGELRPYQSTGMAWMLALAGTGFGGVLADDMGLGKTVQTLAFLASRLAHQKHQVPTPLPCLLVVPTSLVSNWRREAARFVPDLRVLALHGPDRKDEFKAIGEHDLVITTYPLLHRDHKVLFAQDYDIVILDEAQNVKNPTSQAAKLIREVSARQRLALTGTPMENNLEELWCLFDWLIPGLLGNRKSFSETFRKPIEKERNLGRRVVLSKRIAPFLLRRTKDQVVTDLPSRTEMVETVQLTGGQRALYETVRATMHERVRQALSKKGLASSKITVLDALLKLRQACCDPQLLKLESAQKVTTSAKRSRLVEMLESLIAEGRRVLVFSQFVEMLRLIEADIKAQGWDYLMLTGQTKNRGDLVDAFQAGKAPLFLISLKAGGVGLNLTAADTVILYDPWWNPAIERQAMDRVHRIGQDKPVFVHRLIAEGTVETRIAEMQARKQALMDSVFDPEATGTLDMSEEEILSLFAPIQE